MPPTEPVQEEEKSAPEQVFEFMVNLLEGGFQPSASFVEKTYEFCYELADSVLFDTNTKPRPHYYRLKIMLKASELQKQGYALLAADSQRRAQEEQEAVAMQTQGPRIHRLN